MRLYACHFGGGVWDRMARVLEHSAREACPGWDVQVEKVEEVSPIGSDPCYWSNTAKLTRWADVVRRAYPGECLALVDADCMVLRDLSPIWDVDFDLCYTLRSEGGRLPFNAGVVFVRVSPRSVAFVEAWLDSNREMYLSRRLHEQWRQRFGGINQASLGKLISEDVPEKMGVTLSTVPCREWNCEDSSWAEFRPEVTRVVHLKSGLRRSVFGIGASNVRHQQLRRIWKDLERGAGA